jgi:prepilin-type N-terminal cleavage/methylation domain-containing protein
MKIFNSKAGFTLVELMVVISIISLMSSIVAVGLSASKARAQDVAKIQNLDSISKALFSYKIDNGEQAPSSVSSGSITTSGATSGLKPFIVYNPNNPAQFKNILQTLIDNGKLSGMPSDLNNMFYFNGQGPDGNTLTIIGAQLNPITPAPNNTCRPFTSAESLYCVNDIPNNDFCVCVQ